MKVDDDAKAQLNQMVSESLHKQIRSSRIYKYIDTSFLTYASQFTVDTHKLSSIPQGVAQSQRVGDTVRLLKLDIRLNIVAATTDVTNICRFVYFVWKQNDASVSPASGSVFESPASNGLNTHWHFEGRQYYSIIHEDTFNLCGYPTSPASNSQITQNYSIALNDRKITYNLGTTGGTDNIFYQNFSDSVVAPVPVYNIVARLWYYDD